jgi:hypothetical protein
MKEILEGTILIPTKHLLETLDIRAKLFILSMPKGLIQEMCVARIANITLDTISLSDINLSDWSLLLKRHRLALIVDEGILEKVHMLCSIRHIRNENGQMRLNLKIERIPEKHFNKLKDFIHRNFSLGKSGEKYNTNHQEVFTDRYQRQQVYFLNCCRT